MKTNMLAVVGMMLAVAACRSAVPVEEQTGSVEAHMEKPSAGVDCDLRNVTCETPFPVCPVGETPSARGECFGPCVPSNTCRHSLLPRTTDCDVTKITCEIPAPECPKGQTPSVDALGECYGPCVVEDVCL